MTDPLETDSPRIKPFYWQDQPSQRIDLGKVKAEFVEGGRRHRMCAHVVMRFAPRHRLTFELRASNKDPLMALRILDDRQWNGKLELPDRRITLDVLFLGSSGESGAIFFAPKKSVVTATPAPRSISHAVFHLFNFPDFHAPEYCSLSVGKPPRQRSTRSGRVVLRAHDWVITLTSTDRTEGVCKALKEQGGFAITHVGMIERENGSAFSGNQLETVLRVVHWFLSFTLGRWAGVAFPIGLSKAGKRVFEQWGLPRVADGPWPGSCSWFDAHHGELLPQVFPGFMALWSNELWDRALSRSLYWYVGACDGGRGIGTDTGLILAQAALERLAWTYCIQDRKMVSAEAFERRGLSAADRLRLLASSLGIPVELPTSLRALHGVRGQKWQDSMDAITSIRNAIVHPHTKKQLPEDSYYEGWKLSLWYLDLVLLRLCGHMGQYRNRISSDRWAGSVESVPWATSEPEKAGA